MNKWTCGHTAHGTCSRCNSTLAWKSHLLLECAQEAINALRKYDHALAEIREKELVAALNYKGEQ